MRFSTSYLLFSDVKGYSTLTDSQLSEFCSKVIPRIFEILERHHPFYRNSWGDAFVGAFDDAVNAADCALELRDFFRFKIWEDLGLPQGLAIRISLHSGRIVKYDDPLTRGINIYGREVSRAARIEPIVPANEIFATNLIIRTLEGLPPIPKCKWDYIGKHPLAKAWGAEELYRLRRPEDPAKSIEDLELPELVNLFRIPKENDRRDARMREILSEEYASMSLLGVSGFHYVHAQGKNWQFGVRRHLEAGRPMRVLLAHPEGDEARIRKRAEGRRNAEAFLKVPLKRLEELNDRYEKLEVKLTTMPIYCSLFMTDRNLLYDPYHLGCLDGYESGQNLFIVLEFTRGQCYDLLAKHFDFLWSDDSAVSISELASRLRKEIEG